MLVNAYDLMIALKEAGLPDDPTFYTSEDWAKYDEIHAELEKKEPAKEQERPDSYYIIKSEVHFPEGVVEEVTTDIRELSLEQLEDIIEIMPKYTSYYYERLAEKDSQ